MGALFHEGLAELRSSPIVGDVRGLGLTAALEFVQNKDTREPFPLEYNVSDYVRRAALKRGLLVREMGPDIIFMAPPLIISPQETSVLLQRLKDALAETEAWLAAKA
jgi:4-aminobutyrate--pyruvate transaminase